MLPLYLFFFVFCVYNLLTFRFSCRYILYVEYISPIPCYIPLPISLLLPSGQFHFFYVLDTHDVLCVYKNLGVTEDIKHNLYLS